MPAWWHGAELCCTVDTMTRVVHGNYRKPQVVNYQEQLPVPSGYAVQFEFLQPQASDLFLFMNMFFTDDLS
jgi:hypothetical protein